MTTKPFRLETKLTVFEFCKVFGRDGVRYLIVKDAMDACNKYSDKDERSEDAELSHDEDLFRTEMQDSMNCTSKLQL